MTKVTAGKFYERVGRRFVERAPATPDVWICRRVEDYPDSRIPDGGALSRCSLCHAALVYNPARLDSVPAETPKVCMQCAAIEPLPLDEAGQHDDDE